MIRIIFFFLLVSAISAAHGQELSSAVSEEFANKPFGKIVSPKDVKEIMHGKINSKREPIRNKFTGGFDTLLVFSANDTEVIFYQNPEKVFFYKANIFSKDIKLAKGIKVGMSKDNFIHAFGIKTSFKKDLFVVKNSTEYANHKFYFRNNRLVKIELDAGID